MSSETLSSLFPSLSEKQIESLKNVAEWYSLNGEVVLRDFSKLKKRDVILLNKRIGSQSRKNENDLLLSQEYNTFPIEMKDAFSFDCFTDQEAQFWTAKELTFRRDREQFATLPERVKELFYSIFGFFSPGDGAICKNIDEFLSDCDNFTESLFFRFQAAIEVVHAESYGLAIESILTDRSKKEEVFAMVDTLECVKRKAEFMEKYIYSDIPKGYQCIAMACMEGVFFIDLFAIIFYFRDRGFLPEFIFLNEQIKKDETLHRDYYATIAKKYLSQIPDLDIEKVYDIIREAVEIEVDHVKFILSTPVDSEEVDEISGLTIPNLEGFSKMLADQILEMAGLPKLFNVEVELKWMRDMNVSEKTDFYSGRVGNYKRFDASAFRIKDWKKRTGEENSRKRKINL